MFTLITGLITGIINLLSLITGLLLIYTRENEKALELFQRLARDYPHNKSYAEQVSIIEQTLKRTSEPSKTETSASEQDVTAGQEGKPGQEVTAE